MKIAIICFSLTGWETASRLASHLKEKNMEVTLEGKSRYLPDSVWESVKEWTGMQFTCAEGIIFVGACGIAVRSIAPYIEKKTKDPAVLVVDECGTYVISLLSGHLGGANELALEAAKGLGAIPIVTTATDLHERFAVDVFAKKNGCALFHMKAAKEVSAAILAGEPVGFYSEFPFSEALPKGLVLCDREGISLQSGGQKGKKLPVGIAVTIHKGCLPFFSTAQVVPKAVTMGIGCRKGQEESVIQAAAEECLTRIDLYREAIKGFASIDLKKEEAGIQALSHAWQIPFWTYTKEELLQVKGTFTPSAFVQKITGVDNVCERSAVLSANNGTLIQKKQGRDGVTTAAARVDWRIRFE